MADTYTQAELEKIARAAAEKYELPPEYVCAICEHESAGWNPRAIRYEPAFFKRYIHPAHPDAPSTEELTSAMSWGLMQVMGETADELGFKPSFPEFHARLLDPLIGVDFGCRKFQRCFRDPRAADDWDKALAIYNSGKPSSAAGKAYADKVSALIKKYVRANRDTKTMTATQGGK